MHYGVIHGEASSSPHCSSFCTIPKKTFWVDSTLGVALSATADTGNHRRHAHRHSLPHRTHRHHLSITAAINYSFSADDIDFVMAYCRFFGSYLRVGQAAAKLGDTVWLVRVLS
jgi:hypothetical protein